MKKRMWTLCCLLWIACNAPAEAPAKPTPDAPVEVAKPALPKPAAEVRVAAASDLTNAFEELGKNFEQQTGSKVSFSFGSTGLLAKQLAEGAPFDLFAAANVSFVDEVVAKGACDGATRAPYARGRIVLWSQRASALKAPTKLEELVDPRFKHIALANPEHAPYGKAGKQALEKLGLWSKVESRLVYGENVKQTLQYAQSGNADVAIVALSLALGTEGSWSEIPEALHLPIDQALVVCRHGANADGGKAFAGYVASDAGRAVMKRYGFLLPGEAVVPAQ